MPANNKHLRIALVCDFFYPRLGGVEMHIWSLAQHLVRKGHKVIIITHAYNKRKGVRYLEGPVKVYYCPVCVMTDEDTLPTFTATLPLLRWIWIRERIDLVHSHQATSTLANEALAYASVMGIPSIYTDHSLFGFDDVASLILNRVLQTTLSTVDAVICVSYTCRDNLILRAKLTNKTVRVIPNAVDNCKFGIRPNGENGKRIKVVVISRLVYRKGVDLLVGIIPQVCRDMDHVDFIIGGDGNKRLALEEMVEKEQLQERVEFLGAVPHAHVPSVLQRGHVFLNCSLTESFCIALLEAASCGLLIVSTRVGGVFEVLPGDMMLLSEPNVPSLVLELKNAITRQDSNPVSPVKMHERIHNMYSWNRVATDTCSLYENVLQRKRPSRMERFECYLSIGSMAGLVACLLAVTLEFWLHVVEWCQPREFIDVVPDLRHPATPGRQTANDDLEKEVEKGS